MLLVIHIPKTAGTSLRAALTKQFGAKKLALDYGGDSPVTSSQVRKHLYAEGADNDISALVSQLRGSGCQALVGHFNCVKYGDCFAPKELIAFVREPLVRSCSEYLHRINAKTFEGSFSQFIETPAFQNLQSAALYECPPDMFIGVTERYRESLQIINERLGLKLQHKKRNRGVAGGGRRMAGALEKALVDRFYALNQRDVGLYREARARLEQSLEVQTTASLTKRVQIRWAQRD